MRAFTSPLIGAAALLALASFPRPARAAQFDACGQTTNDAFHSCQTEARANLFLASGICNNLADRAARKSCQEDAADTSKEAQHLCSDQIEARSAACSRLGKAPYDPLIDPADFVPQVDNPYFPLVPGTTFIYEGQTPDGFEHDEFEVTHNTKVILGVVCIEVHDVVTTDGLLSEDTLDWFAQDKAGNVWYFGENSKQIEGGLVVGVEGSFTAGTDGAKAGIVVKAQPAVGDFYRQEFLLGEAEDIGEVAALGQTVTVAAGTFGNCLMTNDTIPLEPDILENKFYAPGVGIVLALNPGKGERIELIQIVTK